MKRIIALGRVIHIMAVAHTIDQYSVIDTFCTVRCPDDANKFENLPEEEKEQKERNLVHKILIGRFETGKVFENTIGETVSMIRPVSMPFTAVEVDQFESMVATMVMKTPEQFFKFNPDLTCSQKKYKPMIHKKETILQP